MGNCLVLQKKNMMVKLMMSDGEILLFQPPLQVQQVLEEFPGYSISDELPVHRHLDHNTNLLGGHLYYLLPPKKSLVAAENRPDVVRIKLVVTKQELKEMVSKGGVVSIDDILSQVVHVESNKSCNGWSPCLESIPEGL